MNRKRMAMRLGLIVALSGILPILAVAGISLEVLRRESQASAQAALRTVAEQAAARIEAYVANEKETLRAVAAAAASAPEAEAALRLEEVVLDAPSLGRVMLVSADTPASELPPHLGPPAVARARAGHEVSSPIYLAKDLTPAMDHCVPARGRPGRAVCAQIDLLELWRFVGRIRVGSSGYALAFDAQGRVLASGSGALRAAILTEEEVPQSRAARAAFADLAAAPRSYLLPHGGEVLAGWARISDPAWTVVVEQPASEALRHARVAQWILAILSVLAVGLSVAVGVAQSQKLLGELEVEERWRTAGRIAAGVTHDLGHRVAILQQTAALAETADPVFLPRITENLRSEVATLRKFVADFADLSRDVRAIDFLPLDLDAFAESVRRTSAPHAERAGVQVAVARVGGAWVRGDRYLLERAVLNLLSNAIEASPRGATVEIEVGRGAAGAFLRVKDEGHGIEPSRLEHLFDAFVSTKRTGAHLGMGLANVKRIVDAHGGRVSVTSRVGQGSAFEIALPVLEREAAPAVIAAGG